MEQEDLTTEELIAELKDYKVLARFGKLDPAVRARYNLLRQEFRADSFSDDFDKKSMCGTVADLFKALDRINGIRNRGPISDFEVSYLERGHNDRI